jgi:hypothetical protein
VQCTVVEEKKAKKKKHAPQQPQLQRSLACRATRQRGSPSSQRTAYKTTSGERRCGGALAGRRRKK